MLPFRELELLKALRKLAMYSLGPFISLISAQQIGQENAIATEIMMH
jgi:hypothetical protein